MRDHSRSCIARVEREREQADGRGGSSQEGYSYGLQERKAVYTSEFFDLPFPTPAKGISGFYITNEGFYFKSFVTTSPDEYRDVLVVDYLQRLDANEQFLLPWTDADKERIWGKTTTGGKPAAASTAKKRTLPERQVKP